MNLGDAYAHAGQGEKATSAYKTYLELAPGGAGADYAQQQLEKL